MPPKNNSNHNNSENTAVGQKSSKKVGANPDPWPQDLKSQHFDLFLQSTHKSSNKNDDDGTLDENSTNIIDVVTNFIKVDMPEQRTQLLAKLGEVLAKTLTTPSAAASEDSTHSNNNSNGINIPLQHSLIRNILLPIL